MFLLAKQSEQVFGLFFEFLKFLKFFDFLKFKKKGYYIYNIPKPRNPETPNPKARSPMPDARL